MGLNFGVQVTSYAGAQVIQVGFQYILPTKRVGTELFCPSKAGAQVTRVPKLAGSTVLLK